VSAAAAAAASFALAIWLWITAGSCPIVIAVASLDMIGGLPRSLVMLSAGATVLRHHDACGTDAERRPLSLLLLPLL
jgi:hypothetical protein